MDVSFRWNKKNAYSLAALAPLVPGALQAKEPHDGIMIYSFATRQAESIFREVNKASTDSIYIAGGPHPSGATEETLEFFDYVVVGEGEETLPELIDTIISGKDVSQVKGIAYKDANGKTTLTDKRDPVDLDKYPCFDPNILRSPLEISRGCPFRCKYCQTPRLFGGKVRHRSIDSIVSFAKHYNDLRFTSSNALAYGSDGIHPRLDKVEKLLSTLHRIDGKEIYYGTFPSEVRPEFVTDESLELITKYCTNTKLSLGAQSGSDRILRSILRGHTVDDVVRSIELCFNHGITPIVDFMVGFPDETEEEQEMSLELIQWICKKGGHVHSHYLTPLPDTPYANVTTSPVSNRYRKVMGKMALEGKVTGSWE
ncbi:TIGR04013 family B12-binding domain/radical SAM domain-containing protein [Methanolobus sp.]|jgi:B12-binding domain/radical SAM domain protein|uniref:TIGR04013 family B12-binding domain/radical SAM domain-containing protein n=1 Tax=Methanolobus sp. TaxID=1874737 RepID=UPI0025DF402D|nr:TIGR04013 family B12-binding domain/radical SAM domain-containing protein [Methanolobus sp.]